MEVASFQHVFFGICSSSQHSQQVACVLGYLLAPLATATDSKAQVLEAYTGGADSVAHGVARSSVGYSLALGPLGKLPSCDFHSLG